jgi:cbb3-type cytochrome oxidase maturation protein
MFLVVLLILLVIFALSGSVLYGFYWAAKNGQFENVREGGLCIFDEEEPVGRPTDHFPGEPQINRPAKGSQ